MLLSELIYKPIYAGISPKGKCVGVGISLKNYTVKYLLCASSPQHQAHADFCVSVSAIEEIDDAIYLTRLRPAFPKNCAKIYLDKPIYTENGHYVANVQDLEMENFTALRLFTTATAPLPLSAIAAFSDAVILKKEQPFPIGQRIPAPAISHFFNKKETFITKTNLRECIGSGNLIKVTLSLSPFDLDLSNLS